MTKEKFKTSETIFSKQLIEEGHSIIKNGEEAKEGRLLCLKCSCYPLSLVVFFTHFCCDLFMFLPAKPRGDWVL